MAKGKNKGGKKSKPAKKSGGKKSKTVKSKTVTPKAAKAEAVRVEKPIVVEIPKQEMAKGAPPPQPSPFSEISEEVRNAAVALDNVINQHRSPMSKAEVEDFLNKNSQIQVMPVYSATGFCLDVYDKGKKMRMPFTGEYPLAV